MSLQEHRAHAACAPLAFTHLNLEIGDLDRAEQFYGTTLGLPLERMPTSLVVRWPSFLLVLVPGAPATAGDFHFGFRVATTRDVDAWFARLASQNVPVLADPEPRGAVYVGRIADPDGYVIEIYAEL